VDLLAELVDGKWLGDEIDVRIKHAVMNQRADACSFGAGMPCPRCNPDSRDVNQVPRLPPVMRLTIDLKDIPRPPNSASRDD
jgi:hypothetical protein